VIRTYSDATPQFTGQARKPTEPDLHLTELENLHAYICKQIDKLITNSLKKRILNLFNAAVLF